MAQTNIYCKVLTVTFVFANFTTKQNISVVAW